MKRRIVISIVGVTVVALLVLGVPLAYAVARLYESGEVLQLEREANEALSQVSTTTLLHSGPITVPNDEHVRFVVYDRSARRLGGNGPDRGDSVVHSALAGDSADARVGNRIVVAVPINGDRAVIGVIRASRSADVVVDRTRRAWLVMLAIAVGAVVVASVLAWWQARRLTRPIDDLADVAGRLGGGDFAVRSHPSGIAELDRLGNALDTTADRLGSLVARERAFSTNASHQLRTPIAGLRLNVESALLTPNVDPRTALEGMLPPIDRLEQTVEDLLSLARDTGVQRSPLDASALLHDAEEHWRGLLAARGRRLQVVLDEDLPEPVVAEPAIRQIVDVLISNAERHGQGVVTVAARASAPGALVVQVSDEGSGTLDRQVVFERRTDGSPGVGLALARSLAEAEQARLVLERPGPAPMFSLVIPADDHRD